LKKNKNFSLQNCNAAGAYAFSYMKIIEKWGSGIPRMIRECSEYGLPEPEFIVLDGDFRVNMYRQAESEFGGNTVTTQTTRNTQTSIQTDDFCFTDEDKAILALVHKWPELTQKELSMELGWSVDRVKYYLNKMKKQQIIKRVGSSHNGHWEFLIEEDVWKG